MRRRATGLIMLFALWAGTTLAQEQQDSGALLSEATNTQEATRSRLGVLGDAFSCPDARFISYRRSDVEPEITDQWYVASQLWADALLLQTSDLDTGDTRCYVDKGFVFLDRLWD